MLFANAKIGAVIPVTDHARARKFYEDVLGLEVFKDDDGSTIYKSGGTYLQIYQRATATSGDHTTAGFEIEGDFNTVVDGLIARGVTFDTFDIPGDPWDARGVLPSETGGTAWFKDPDGNVIILSKGNFLA